MPPPQFAKNFACTDSLTPDLIEFDWKSASIPHPEDWAPPLLAAARTIQSSPVPMMLLVGQQGTMFPNSPMKWLLASQSEEQATGCSVLEYLPHWAESYTHAWSGTTCRPGLPIRCCPAKSTTVSWFHLDFVPITEEDGTVVGVQVVATDVTYYIERIRSLYETEQRFRLAMESSGMVGIWDLDVRTNTSTADANVARTFGLDPADCLNGVDDSVFIRTLHEDDRARVYETLQSAIRENRPYRCKYRVIPQNGRLRWVITSGKPCFNENGELIRLLGIVVDVTDQMETAIALEESRFQFETLTETLPQIVWSCDGQGRHDYFSRRWSEFTGIPPQDITEETWKQLVDPEHWETVSATWDEARREGKPYDIDYRFRHHSGVFRWLRVMALPMRDDSGRITRWFGTSIDVHDTYLATAERERLSQELERIATEDQLTEVLTRRAFVERAKVALNRATQQETPIGLIMLDIDHFKSINDTYGHPGGDKVLTIVARRLKASLDEADLVGRLGGEEFGVLLHQCNDYQAHHVAERLRRAVHQNPIAVDDHLEIAVTISVGVTAKVPRAENLDDLLLIADKALYAAKTSGRNRSVFFADLIEQVSV
ncbi:sensor domain-containing diguanylate cyclase [Planctomicrobium sp. SH661]|uniref:sensor domain-containing diguanylate cyclase n=1 Tax=Planctomicrobium sp. SH661 TaxID=3448124 RepID=UPI003F5B2D9C